MNILQQQAVELKLEEKDDDDKQSQMTQKLHQPEMTLVIQNVPEVEVDNVEDDNSSDEKPIEIEPIAEGACDDEALLDLYNGYINLEEDGWESIGTWINADQAEANANGARHWKLKDMTGKQPTDIILKLENTFPAIEPEDLFELISNIEKRVKWDERWVEGKVIQKDDNSTILHTKTPKPPIPLISQRELVLQFWNIKNWQAGRHLSISKSVEHADVPIKTGMFAYTRS